MSGLRRYAVVGFPVRHSLSPTIHANFAKQLGLPIEYDKVEVAPGEFAGWVREFFANGGSGLNATLPHKQEAMAIADSVSHGARMAGAANTLKLGDDGSVSACNTDGAGMLLDLKKRHGCQVAGSKVLILGAGGSAAGLANSLLEEKPASLVIANRTVSKAQDLASHLMRAKPATKPEAWALNEIESKINDVDALDLVIHTTSAVHAGELPELPRVLFAKAGLVYDINYGEKSREFIAMARQQGAGKVVDGLGMLVEQAALSFAYWEGKMPDTGQIYGQLSAK